MAANLAASIAALSAFSASLSVFLDCSSDLNAISSAFWDSLSASSAYFKLAIATLYTSCASLSASLV